MGTALEMSVPQTSGSSGGHSDVYLQMLCRAPYPAQLQYHQVPILFDKSLHDLSIVFKGPISTCIVVVWASFSVSETCCFRPRPVLIVSDK